MGWRMHEKTIKRYHETGWENMTEQQRGFLLGHCRFVRFCGEMPSDEALDTLPKDAREYYGRELNNKPGIEQWRDAIVNPDPKDESDGGVGDADPEDPDAS